MWKILVLVAIAWALMSTGAFVGVMLWLQQEGNLDAGNSLAAAQVFTQVAGGGIAVAGLVGLLQELRPHAPRLNIEVERVMDPVAHHMEIFVLNTGNAAAVGLRATIGFAEHQPEWSVGWADAGHHPRAAFRYGIRDRALELVPGQRCSVARGAFASPFTVTVTSENAPPASVECAAPEY